VGKYLMADSVRVEKANPDVEKVYVVDNEDATGYSETGTSWATWAGDDNDHRSNYRYVSGTDTATFSFTGVDDGVYRVSANWTPSPNRTTGAAYIIEGIGSAIVSQEPSPEDAFENSYWKNLFYAVNVTNGSISVTVSNTTTDLLIADAVRLEKVDMDYSSGFALIDNFEEDTFGFDISSNVNWTAHNAGTVVPMGTIVSNGNGQAAQLLDSHDAGYNINLGINTIPDGTKGTLFFRTRSYANQFNLGSYLTDWDWAGGDNWWDHDDAGFYGKGNTLKPQYNVGDSKTVELATWYNVWVVADNVADTFDLYLSQGYDGATNGLTSVTVDTDVAFRDATGDLDYFMFLGTDDVAEQGGLIDDIYVAQGKNLQLPAPLGPTINPKGTIILIQ
jgi:hypothetical protein